MLDQKEFTIGEQQWLIQTLPSSRGIQVAIYLSHIVAGAADGFSFSEKIMDTEINIAALIAGVLKRLNANETPGFIKKLVIDSVIRPDLKAGDAYETVFAGNYEVMWDVLERIIEHNKFGDVLKKKITVIIAQLSSDQPSQGLFTRSTSGP